MFKLYQCANAPLQRQTSRQTRPNDDAIKLRQNLSVIPPLSPFANERAVYYFATQNFLNMD